MSKTVFEVKAEMKMDGHTSYKDNGPFKDRALAEQTVVARLGCPTCVRAWIYEHEVEEE